jgi:hypothetical protein
MTIPPRPAKQTLGTLVRQLLHSCVVDAAAADSEPAHERDTHRFGIWLRVHLPTEEHERLTDDLRELVHLRNNLVHHLSEHHDLRSAAGCRPALQSLAGDRMLVKQHYENLRALARLLRDMVQSDALRDCMDRIAHS